MRKTNKQTLFAIYAKSFESRGSKNILQKLQERTTNSKAGQDLKIMYSMGYVSIYHSAIINGRLSYQYQPITS